MIMDDKSEDISHLKIAKSIDGTKAFLVTGNV